MTYVNGYPITLSAYAILTADKRETTRIASARRVENARLIDVTEIRTRRIRAHTYRTVAAYTLTATGAQVAAQLRQEAQRGE